MTAQRVHVELHVDNLEESCEFYEELGFEVVWETEGYAALSLGGTPLCLFYRNEPIDAFADLPLDNVRGVGVEIKVLVDDLADIFERATALEAVVTPLRDRPWGLRDFRLRDPSGFYVCVTEARDVLAENYGGRRL